MQPTAVNGDAVGEVEIYQSSDGSVRLDVRTDGDTAWLTRQQIGDLFGRDVKTIGKHVAHARREELADESVVAKFATVQIAPIWDIVVSFDSRNYQGCGKRPPICVASWEEPTGIPGYFVGSYNTFVFNPRTCWLHSDFLEWE